MSASNTYTVRNVDGYRGASGDHYAVDVCGIKASDPTGTVVVRFLAADRLCVDEEVTHGSNDGVLCGKYRYRLSITYTRQASGEWVADIDSRGTPGVYHHRGRDYWCRPARTIDARIRAMVAGAVTAVVERMPDARHRAEVVRAEREHESATANVERIRAELAEAERVRREAADALHAARRMVDATRADHAEEGYLLVPRHSTATAIAAVFADAAAHGWEVVDCLQSGDDYTVDSDGTVRVPLVRVQAA